MNEAREKKTWLINCCLQTLYALIVCIVILFTLATKRNKEAVVKGCQIPCLVDGLRILCWGFPQDLLPLNSWTHRLWNEKNLRDPLSVEFPIFRAFFCLNKNLHTHYVHIRCSKWVQGLRGSKSRVPSLGLCADKSSFIKWDVVV